MLIILLNYSGKGIAKVRFKIFEYLFSLQYYETRCQNNG